MLSKYLGHIDPKLTFYNSSHPNASVPPGSRASYDGGALTQLTNDYVNTFDRRHQSEMGAYKKRDRKADSNVLNNFMKTKEEVDVDVRLEKALLI